MGELEASPQEHLGEIPQTQLVTEAIENNEQNTICGILERIEGNARVLVEGTFAY